MAAVVPVVAITTQGVLPAVRSCSMACASARGDIALCASVAMVRIWFWPNPARIAALLTELWAWAEV